MFIKAGIMTTTTAMVPVIIMSKEEEKGFGEARKARKSAVLSYGHGQ